MKWNTCRLLAGTGSVACALVCLIVAGCASAPAGPPAKAAAGQSGAILWAQNCGHCHNIRSPNSYSDAQWEVTAMHMRIRANLTAQEHREILAFLRSAH